MAYRNIQTIKTGGYTVACSQTNKKMLAQHYSGPIDCIQNGVDIEYYTPHNTLKKAEIRKKIGLPECTHMFLSVGSLIQLKNPLEIIRAYKSCPFNNDQAILVFVGEGPLLRACQREAEGAENILFAGWQKNVLSFLQGSSFYISSSLSEGLPNTVLEAMACGVPPVLSDIPSHLELVGDEPCLKELTYKKGSGEELRKVLSNIGRVDYQMCVDACIRRIYRSFTAQLMSRKYQKIYRGIINER